MKECFVAKRFSESSLEMLQKIEEVLNRYAAQGYDLSLRQLYYQLVSANIVENTERSYKNVGGLVCDARLAGLLNWDMIKDRGRETISPTHWNSPEQILRAAAEQYRIDKWMIGQPCHIEVMVEKQALEGVLIPVCRELDVSFSANKGYSSASTMYESGRRLQKHSDQRIVIIYLGDHDPSGIDMSRDVKDRLTMFSGSLPVEVQRVALNMDQIRALNPPENPAKITDSRAKAYIEKYGDKSWELDAIEPAELARIVKEAVEALRDEKNWKIAVDLEKKQQDRMFRMIQKMEDDEE